MRHGAAPEPAADQLRVLIYELLDAHADMIELRGDLADELRWAAHLDYLRALQRKSREILAASHAAGEPIGST